MTPRDNLDGLNPWWVNAVYKLGVTAVLAVGLAWFLTRDVKGGLEDMQTQHAAILVSLQQQAQMTTEIRADLMSMKVILRAICVNAAKDEPARTACLER